MSLKYAILGFLKIEPQTGYDLANIIERSINFFWSAKHSQVYTTLKELETKNMVRKKIIYQKDRPNKKVYSLTEKGEKELNTWLKDPSFSSVMREEFLIKAFFFGLIDKTTALAQIERYHQRHNQLLEEYLNLEKILKSLIESPKERKIKLYWYLTLKCGIRCSKALIDWCDEVKKEILNLK